MTTVPPSTSSELSWAVAINHEGDWTEADFEALPKGLRVELHYGRLILTPSPAFVHNWVIRILSEILGHAVGNRKLAGLDTDVRMADGRAIYRPDVLILREPERGRPIPAANLQLVVEVVSPGGGIEWTLKMTDYAAAGIPAYLILEQVDDGYAATHHVLRDGKYEVAVEAERGAVLAFEEPFHAVIDLTELEY